VIGPLLLPIAVALEQPPPFFIASRQAAHLTFTQSHCRGRFLVFVFPRSIHPSLRLRRILPPLTAWATAALT
jgi:hypothetical protein